MSDIKYDAMDAASAYEAFLATEENAQDKDGVEMPKEGTTTESLTEPTLEDTLEAKQEIEETQERVEEDAQQKEDKEDPLSAKFAALSRKEKAIRQREAELEQRLKELEERSSVQEEPEEEQEPLEWRLKKNPIKTLEEMGIPFDKLAEIGMNDGEIPLDMKMKLMQEEMDKKYSSQLEELKKKLEEKDQSEQQKREQQAISDFKNKITTFVKDNGEVYEFINADEAYEDVFDVINQYYEQTGEILDTKEAAEKVERYLEDRFKRVMQAQKSKKLMGIDSPKAKQSQPSKTLKNSDASPESKVDYGALSHEEAIREAGKILNWVEND